MTKSETVKSNNYLVQENVTADQTEAEFELLWNKVQDAPDDFASWTKILKAVEQMQWTRISQAYDLFLHHYPYCYLYWKKYADCQLRQGSPKEALEVLRRAVLAFPLSVDLWCYYLNLFIKFNKDDKHAILTLFDQAVNSCANDYRSDQFWQFYIRWLMDNKLVCQVTAAYDKIFSVPTAEISRHFKNFESFVKNNDPERIIDKQEYQKHSDEWISLYYNNGKIDSESRVKNVIRLIVDKKEINNQQKIEFVKKKIIEKRKNKYEKMKKEIKERTCYEENIKRPYFHVNPLDIFQLNNWMKYLNWEINGGDVKKIILLFERCLVSCALYEEMWIKYVNFLVSTKESNKVEDGLIENVFKRGTIQISKSLKFCYLWSLYEEQKGNIKNAIDLLDEFSRNNPDVVECSMYKINLFHRLGDFDKVKTIFYVEIEKHKSNQSLASHLSIRFARFMAKIMKDDVEATKILRNAIKLYPLNYTLYLQLIDLIYQQQNFNVNDIILLFDESIAICPKDIKLLMIRRKLEFIQDFGCHPKIIQSTINSLCELTHHLVYELEDQFEVQAVKKQKTDSSLRNDCKQNNFGL